MTATLTSAVRTFACDVLDGTIYYGYNTATGVAVKKKQRNESAVVVRELSVSGAVELKGMKVSSADVFVLAEEINNKVDVTRNVLLWKNEVPIDLKVPSELETGLRFVYGNYLALDGNQPLVSVDMTYSDYTSKAGYFIGEDFTRLPATKDYSYTYEIVKSGKDVYVLGFQQDSGSSLDGYWVNGVWTDFPNSSRSIEVYGFDVHEGQLLLSGFCPKEGNNPLALMYCRNGEWKPLVFPVDGSLVMANWTEPFTPKLIGDALYIVSMIETSETILVGYWSNK